MAVLAQEPYIETEIELARLAAIVASSNDAIVSKNLNGIINSWNAAAERIFGYKAEEIIGRSITTIIPQELQSEEVEIIGKIRRGERVEHFDTVRVRKDGRRIHVSITVSPLRNSRGEIVGASKIARDITERKREEELKEVLVNELNHRTKNLLATVQAIASQTFDALPNADNQLTLFRQRIGALIVSQDLLTRNGWRGAPLNTMLEAVLGPFRGDAARIEMAQGPQLELTLRQTNALAMALHELATNAAKYGALSGTGGSVRVSWAVMGDQVELRWEENGGPAVTIPKREGFGTHMIRNALRHELNADVVLDYASHGLRFAARFPLAATSGETAV
ncbi:PAS domain S-box protein [Pelagibacterium sp. H642]|uniref:sensor histidine kinase n=1 Tax=Pelagibacterium sp. H642 TaxID=1881069 RepID=UPI00281648F4|nr:PAS domain S-box protein [Pelagibacterium sp. H642]WMT90712.1 PAS domain S-box protein [Pelagibacterium sp. H642]